MIHHINIQYRPAVYTRPTVASCPADFSVYSPDRIKSVSWTAPTFTGNSVSVTQPPAHLPGSSYSWGKYDVTYVAQDAAGHKAFCHFAFYVQSKLKLCFLLCHTSL